MLLLRGDIAKSLISAYLAELRLRAPAACFFYGSRPPDSELRATRLRSGRTLVALMARRFLHISYIMYYHGTGDV